MKKGLFKGLIVVLLVGITLLGFGFYKLNKINTNKQDVKYYSGPAKTINVISADLAIDKVDENGNPLEGITFKLRSNNDNYEYILRHGKKPNEEEYAGYYYVDDYDDYLSLTEVEKVLTAEQKKAIEKVSTTADLKDVFGNNASCTIKTPVEGEAAEQLAYYPDCAVMLPTVFTLEETKVPVGYTKKKVLIPGVIYVYYNLSDSGVSETDKVPVSLSNINVYTVSNGYFMEYGKVDKTQLMGIDISQAVRLWRRYGEQNDYCTSNIRKETFDYQKLPIATTASSLSEEAVFNFLYRYYGCPIYLQNERGEVILEVIASVNNENSITTNMNKSLAYKVTVRNTGTADAFDSVVVAKLPNNLELMEGSISHGGEYRNGAIYWNVPKIERGSDIELTYETYAPKGVNIFQSYVGEASVENYALEGSKILSNKTYVKLSLTNPSTYAPVGMIVLIIIAGSVLVYSKRKQAKQK